MRLNSTQEKLLTRAKAMKQELDACDEFIDEDCELLDSQLQEAVLFAERFVSLANELRRSLKNRSEP